MTHYQNHDKNILRYMNNVLKRLNLLKNVFKEFRLKQKTNQKQYKENHFNFFKMHIFQHYFAYIKEYDNLVNYSIDKNENIHKKIKLNYDKTNKYDDYQKQLFRHNTRKINMMTMSDLLLYENTKNIDQIDFNSRIKIMIISKF